MSWNMKLKRESNTGSSEPLNGYPKVEAEKTNEIILEVPKEDKSGESECLKSGIGCWGFSPFVCSWFLQPQLLLLTRCMCPASFIVD